MLLKILSSFLYSLGLIFNQCKEKKACGVRTESYSVLTNDGVRLPGSPQFPDFGREIQCTKFVHYVLFVARAVQSHGQGLVGMYNIVRTLHILAMDTIFSKFMKA